MVGKKIAELCLSMNIEKVCFDRGGNVYHGRVQARSELAPVRNARVTPEGTNCTLSRMMSTPALVQTCQGRRDSLAVCSECMAKLMRLHWSVLRH